MASAVVELDKTWESDAGESYGAIQIRVVVLKSKPSDEGAESQAFMPHDLDESEPIPEFGKTPLDNYLERPKGGKQCAVFLVNGQRHDGWDNTYLVRDLGFKYLRNRTMLIVDLDGLVPEALAKLVQGSRQGFFKGEIFDAIRDRIYATLKGDPDLKRLQAEAEQEIADLESGDDVVKDKLDQLIEHHHAAALHTNLGEFEAGPEASDKAKAFGPNKRQNVVVNGDASVGTPAEYPVFVNPPSSATIRLYPDEEKQFRAWVPPQERWQNVEALDVRLVPKVPELFVGVLREANDARVTLRYDAPDDMDDDDYPVVTTLKLYAAFKDCSEPRLLEKSIVVAKPKQRPPRPQPPLLPTPTFLRVASRQPVKLIAGGPSTHVKLRWDGQDHLTIGSPPAWSFEARCLTMATYPSIGSSKPCGGRFELVLDTPHGLLPGQVLSFEVTATGPGGQSLSAQFVGEVVEPVSTIDARKVHESAPAPGAHRRPPYQLRYVTEPQWDTVNCWGDAHWMEDDAACFAEPTDSTPLTLLVNKDAALLKGFRQEMVQRKLVENTVKERVNRYTAHVAFHLYQMYEYQRQRRDAPSDDENGRAPTDDELRAEINRVAATLIRLMQVTS